MNFLHIPNLTFPIWRDASMNIERPRFVTPVKKSKYFFLIFPQWAIVEFVQEYLVGWPQDELFITIEHCWSSTNFLKV